MSSVKPIPSDKEFAMLMQDEKTCIRYLASKSIFYETLPCPGCRDPMVRDLSKKVFRCPKKQCKQRELSLKKHTFFYSSRLPCFEIMRIARMWLADSTRNSTLKLTGHSSKTITSMFNYFRQLVTQDLTQEKQIIGGQDIIVEIDETKLGKRKYHRGHRVEGVWVVCGIERTREKKTFCIPVEKRDAKTLEDLIKNYVRSGSIIYTDLWKGYTGLNSNLGFCHKKVNHSQTFKDPITGVCTNTVEGLNNGLKLKIKPRNRTKKGITEHLQEFVWRRVNKNRLWDAFIDALKNIHYD